MNCKNLKDLEKFLEVQEQALGSACPEVAATISKIADQYLEDGDLDKAEANYRRALEIRQGLRGPYRSDVEESERCLEKVLKLKHAANKAPIRVEAVVIEEHPLKISCNEVGVSSRDRENRINEIANVETELSLLRNTLGDDKVIVADCLTKLADLYCRRGMYDKIEPLLMEALSIRRKNLGSEHPHVSTDLKNVGRLYFFQGRYSLAEPFFKRALTIREKIYGKGHPKVLDVVDWYAKTLRKMNKTTMAETLERESRRAP